MVMSPDMVMAAGQVLQSVNPIQKAIFGGKKKKGPSIDDQYAAAAKWGPHIFRKDLEAKMKLADIHGIHKLQMLGLPAAALPGVSVPPPDGGQDSGVIDALSAAGEGFSRIRAAGAQSTMERLQERLLTAQVEGQEIQNARSASELALATTGVPPALGKFDDNFYEALSNQQPGIQRVRPLFARRLTPDGKQVLEFETEDQDNELLQSLSVLLMAADYARQKSPPFVKWLTRPNRWVRKMWERR